MNIIYARMPGYTRDVPSDAVMREVEKQGHQVTIIDDVDYIPSIEYDFVFSPYESVTLLGEQIAQKVGAPHYAHLEWLPPWRALPGCDPTQYGYAGTEPEFQNLAAMQREYKRVGEAWLRADVRSIGGKGMVGYHQQLLGEKAGDTLIRLPNIDPSAIVRAKRMYAPKKSNNRIITVSRLAMNKRFDILVELLNKVTVPVEWVIVGEGPAGDMIKKQLTNKNVSLTMHGLLWGWSKLYEMMKSTIVLGCWTGMSLIEGAILGAAPISIEPPPNNEGTHTIIPELYNGKLTHYSYAELDLAAGHIDTLIKDGVEMDSVTKSVSSFVAGKMGIQPTATNASDIIAAMESWRE